MQESWEESRTRASFEVQQWRGERESEPTSPRRKKGGLYTPSQRNMTVWDLPGRKIRPRAGLSAPRKSPLDWAGYLAGYLPRIGHSGRIIRPPENCRNTKTKTGITLASGVRFWWSWACFEARNKLYKIMQETIIVQQGRIETNDERFDLSKKYIPVKPPISKMQQVAHAKTILNELELVMRISTSSKTSHG